MTIATRDAGQTEVDILARMLDDENGEMPKELAHYLMALRVNERDRARMHDLASRNQEGTLTIAEKEEMLAYGKATTLLSILKSKARRTLGVTLETREAS